MRHKTIWNKALFLDEFIEKYNKIRHRRAFPHNQAGIMVKLLFPESKRLGKNSYAKFKRAYYVSSRTRDLVLKIGDAKNVKLDGNAYKYLPKTVRNRYFAKIYWHTKYCLLQKYGKEVKIPKNQKSKLKDDINWHLRNKPYYLSDIRPDNIRQVDGTPKVIDATLKKR